jgi:hypothetical protein
MPDKAELRQKLIDNLDDTMAKVNAALRGQNLTELEATFTRLGRGGHLPHWYQALKENHNLPNLDGKTVGSVLEMTLVAVLENHTLKDTGIQELRVNPARGVDIPDLDLGVKSPSTNYCTSEPFFTAYERLLGNEYDALVMLTDYQEAKVRPPLQIQVKQWRYLRGTEIADSSLCAIARSARELLLEENEAWVKKVFRFLAYVNQSDWRAKYLIKMLPHIHDDEAIRNLVSLAETDFNRQNAARTKRMAELLPEDDLIAIQQILDIAPLKLGVIDAADNWVNETQKEAGRYPNENEWNRLINGPLDGKIGMSFALQWRYNFGRVFGVDTE